ncbi:oral-facial-digital syndrome 1 protein homolog [Asterias rubens]|uniref:oral-facial-digital syndrome 1 protein homolog n=1 Tax=Asterias rubens TaxID=7604 RepID=UPI001455146A|nr:oral-facial-digital syndrome 1 protein homolog [Asterias rubens]
MAELQEERSSMTADELKAKLYHSFRQKGLVDSLKSQLRTQLVSQLRFSSLSQKPPSSALASDSPKDEEGSLMQRASNSLVADHLRRCQYEYSLAVFLPESETSKDKMFTVRELLQMLGIYPESKLFRNVTENMRGYQPKGLLWQLLCVLISTQGRSHDVGIQVDNAPSHVNSIEKKLTAVDELFDNADGYHEGTTHGLQAKLLSLQRKMEAQAKLDITTEIIRFKESEGKRIELQEREKYRREMAKERKEMERTYQAKGEALQERERSTVERLQKHQEMVERETYSQRQSLLDELQTLKKKEAELKREADLNKRAMMLEEGRRKDIEESLKIREASLATIEETYEKKYKTQIRQNDAEQQVKLSERLQDIERREARLREGKSHLERESELQSSLKEELQERKSRVAELEVLYQQARFESVAVSKRNEVLTERLRDMVDYQSIKEDNAVLKHDLDRDKRRLNELLHEQKKERTRYEETMRGVSEKMTQPSPQVVTHQAELHRVQNQLEQERNLFQHKEAQYRSTAKEEVERSAGLTRRLEEQGNQMKEMNNQIADLRNILRQTQMALSNEIYRKPAPRTSPQRPYDALKPDDAYNDSMLHQAALEQQILLADERGSQPIMDADDDQSKVSPNASLAFLEETKARFQQLEREAESLEHNYQNFQLRTSDMSALPVSPVKTSSQYRAGRKPSARESASISMLSKQVSTDKGSIKNQDVQPSPIIDGTKSQRKFRPVDELAEFQRLSIQTNSTDGHGGHEETDPLKMGLKTTYSSAGSSSRRSSPHQTMDLSNHFESPTMVSNRRPQRGETLTSILPPATNYVFTTKERLADSESITQLIDKPADAVQEGAEQDLSEEEYMMRMEENARLQNEEKARQQMEEDFRQQQDEKERIQNEDKARQQKEGRDRLQKEETERLQKEEAERQQTEGKARQQREEDVRLQNEEKARLQKAEDQRLQNEEKVRLQKAEEQRLQNEEEDRLQREWEEKRRKQNEERQKKEDEARERENAMLMQLQKQQDQQELPKVKEEEKKAPEKEEPPVEESKDESVTIDPVMQKYMKMIQEKKQKQDTPQKPVSYHSPKSESGSNFAFEIEAEVEPNSLGQVSDNTEDPFDDW